MFPRSSINTAEADHSIVDFGDNDSIDIKPMVPLVVT